MRYGLKLIWLAAALQMSLSNAALAKESPASVIRSRISELNARLNETVIGQTRAKTTVMTGALDLLENQVSHRTVRAQAMLLFGPANSGKRLIAETTAAGLGAKLITINMSEFETQSGSALREVIQQAAKTKQLHVIVLNQLEKSGAAAQKTIATVLQDDKVDLSKIMIIGTAGFENNMLTQVSLVASDLQKVLVEGGLNVELLATFSDFVPVSAPTVPEVYEIMKVKVRKMVKQLEDSGYRINVNENLLAQALIKNIYEKMPREAARPQMGFAFPKQKDLSARPDVLIAYSDVKRELDLMRKEILAFAVMKDSNTVVIKVNDKSGSMSISEPRPVPMMCKLLFTSRG